MRLPSMKYVENRSQKTIVQALGVNYGENTTDGQFADTRNLSSRMFPCLSQRAGRQTIVDGYTSATDVWYKNGIIVVDGTDLKHNGMKVGTVSPGKKQFANVNTKVVIFPDKVMYDTETQEFRSLEANYTSETGMVAFQSNGLEIHLGNYYGEVVSSGKLPKTLVMKTEYFYRMDTYGNVDDEVSFEEHTDFDTPCCEYVLNGFSVNKENGTTSYESKAIKPAVEMGTGDIFADESLGLDGVTKWGKVTYVPFGEMVSSTRIEKRAERYLVRVYEFYREISYDVYEVKGTSFGGFSGFEAMNFRVGDTVEISGATSLPGNNKTLTIRGFSQEDVDGTIMYGILFDGGILTAGEEAGAVTIKRSVPNLTVICEQDNRLYGTEGNTIHVSALGDPTNFNTYDGVDTDSYAVAVATEGDFTGAIGYGNGVLFFKEDCLHKLMGSYPSEFAVYDYVIPGVKKGSEGSLWNINEVVYYHGREGVYRYTGGAPELLSGEFGLRRFDTAAAGAQGENYYISMRDKASDTYGLWVYDIRRGIWLQEDETQAVAFARDGGNLYYIDGADSRLVLVNPESSEEEIDWSATFCTMNEVYLNRKSYSKILLRLEMEEDATFKIEVRTDGGDWVEHKTFQKGPHRTMLVPVRPNRCDSFQIRLSGTGRTVVRTMVREFELGSDY